MLSLDDIRRRRSRILDIAARHGASRVRLFGSAARGEASPISDVDLLVHLEDERTLLDHIALKHELESLLGCPVDVVDDEAVRPDLREEILAEAITL